MATKKAKFPDRIYLGIGIPMCLPREGLDENAYSICMCEGKTVKNPLSRKFLNALIAGERPKYRLVLERVGAKGAK